MKEKRLIRKILYHTLVLGLGFLMIYPVLQMISGSFKDNSEILRGTLSLIPAEVKTSNYSTG